MLNRAIHGGDELASSRCSTTPACIHRAGGAPSSSHPNAQTAVLPTWPVPAASKVRPSFFSCPASVNMLLPAHQRLLDDANADDGLTDAQVQELLGDVSRRMREQQAGEKPAVVDAARPFKLPKLNPGQIAGGFFQTNGSITRLDSSKLIDEKQQALANGVKKIEDPILAIKKSAEVSPYPVDHPVCNASKGLSSPSLPLMITFPFLPEADFGPVLGTSLRR